MTLPARLVLFFCLISASGPASAHRLRVFATVDDGAVAGYGFFVGGGRPRGAIVIMRNAEGEELWRGATDQTGKFSWRPEKPGALTIVVDARDGHIAEAKIAADRFGDETAAAAAPRPVDDPLGASAVPGAPAAGCAGVIDAARIERVVDKAVARQVRPLLEATEVGSGSVRFNDVMGGIGMIVGLAGIGIWASSRRRKDAPAAGTGA